MTDHQPLSSSQPFQKLDDTLKAGDTAAAAVAVAPRVTLEALLAKIEREEYAVFGGVLTVCVLFTVNGFTVTGESACASPENFNEELGRKFARERAVSALWGFEGYLLRERLWEAAIGAAEDTRYGYTLMSQETENEQLARIAHEVNRAWCAFNGDNSQLPWDDAPDWQRSSAINGMAFHRANPDAGDSASHDSWMAEKVAAGWVYGPEKNPEASPPTHHCIVPFDQLPRDQQFKDRLFRTIAHAGFMQ